MTTPNWQHHSKKDANVFVISHKTGMDDRFDSVLRYEKVKGFSRLAP